MSEHANLVFANGFTIITLAAAVGTVIYWGCCGVRQAATQGGIMFRKIIDFIYRKLNLPDCMICGDTGWMTPTSGWDSDSGPCTNCERGNKHRHQAARQAIPLIK